MIPQTKIDQAAKLYVAETVTQCINIDITQLREFCKLDFTAGVRFAESEMGISEEDRIYLKNTLALMNSMIKCGENHSKVSEEMLTKAFLILKPTHENES